MKHAAVAPTCTETGNIEYYSNFVENGNYSFTRYYVLKDPNQADHENELELLGTDIADVTIPIDPDAHQLTYHPATPATTAAPGNTAYYVCSECGKYFSDANGENEIAYEDTVIPKLMGAKLAGYSVSLDGDIAVNFYVKLSSEVASSSTAYMQFSVPGTSPEYQLQTVYVKDLDPTQFNNETYYVFKCRVAAKDMKTQISATLIDGDSSCEFAPYSVKDYADWLLAHTDDSAEYAKAAPLVKAMLNYGAAAQLYFSKGATPEEKLANYDLLADDKAINVDTIPQAEEAFSLPDGVVFEGATLSLKSETTLSLYFSGLTDPTFSCDGKTVETVENGSYWVARIRNISANELQDTFTVTFDGGSATYCPMNYCSNALSSSNEYLQNVAKALYLYSEAAKVFF